MIQRKCAEYILMMEAAGSCKTTERNFSGHILTPTTVKTSSLKDQSYKFQVEEGKMTNGKCIQ
jgi:hypothetical protein